MKKIFTLSLSLTLALVLTSCEENHFREDKFFAGGVHVKASTLNKGKQIYTEYCMPCHGVDGDGKGVASKGMKVPPRNFKTGIYKFGKVVSGDLPHDKHFFSILEKGLSGTAMLPWDLKEGQMHAVIQYIKTFAPKVWEGKDKKLGVETTVGKDPYGLAHKSSAIALGKKVYHGEANCQSCHRAFVGHQELSEITGDPISDFESDLYFSKLQITEWEFSNLPPDFTWDEVRSAVTVEELAIRIASGVGGTSMPAWKETITDNEIWAVSYYVRSLMDMKKSDTRKELMNKIKAANK